jgi:hypothetical protein
MQRATFKIRDRKGNPQITITAHGKSRKSAIAKGKSFIRKRLKNVEMGFYDAHGFHPIRASRDYDPDRVDELYRYGRGGAERGRPRKKAKRRRSR